MQSGMHRPGVLLTGGNGYVGMLLLNTLLAETDVHTYVLLRQQHSADRFLGDLVCELTLRGIASAALVYDRVTIIPFDSYETLPETLVGLRGKVDEVIHAAGSVDYFDSEILESANVQFTRAMLEVARVLQVQRFVFISTAFACGYLGKPAEEQLLEEPPRDPTAYTASKRKAEYFIANSDIPFLILRPGIVIGDSRTGRYTGKRYGLYQFMVGLERLLCNRKVGDLHVVASDTPLQFIHQDMLQNAFLAAWQHLGNDTFINVVPRSNSSPSMTKLWEFLAKECVLPEQVIFYDDIDDVPMKKIDPRVRAFLSFAAVNTQIASHSWQFRTGTLDKLIDGGLVYTDPTHESVTRCMFAFLAGSTRCQRHLDENRAQYTDLEPSTRALRGDKYAAKIE